MLGQLLRLVFKIFLGGVVIGAATAALGIGAIAVSELLSRRQNDQFDDDFDDLGFGPEDQGAAQELDEEFLSLLACPVCKTSVRRDGDHLVCDTCNRRYPIRDGIPVMLVDEAEIAGSAAAPAE